MDEATLPDELPALLAPYYDIVFRRLFDQQDHCRLLRALLNALLRLESGHQLTRVTLIPTQLGGDHALEKESIMDIRAIDQSGRQLNIEMHTEWYGAYRQRAVYFLSRFHSSQLERGMDYVRLRPTISIHILNWNLLPSEENPRLHSIYELRERASRDLFCDQLELHIIELRRLEAPVQDLRDAEEKWLYFIRHGHEMTAAEIEALREPEIEAAAEKLKVISQERLLRLRYMDRLKAEHDRISFVPGILEEGRQAGLKEGRRAGLKEGRRAGLKEGRRAGLKEGLLRVYERRFGPPPATLVDRLEVETEESHLLEWMELFATASAEEIGNVMTGSR